MGIPAERAERDAKVQAILQKRSVEEVRSPLEPLLVKLVKGYINDTDLNDRLVALYKVLEDLGQRPGFEVWTQSEPADEFRGQGEIILRVASLLQTVI